MPQFRNISDLNRFLNVVLEEVLLEVSEEIEREVLERVERNVYSSTPHDYQRTWDFLASVTRAEPRYEKGSIEIEIYYDSDKLLPRAMGNGEWNQHMSVIGDRVDDVWNGKSVPELLPLWIEYGTENGLKPRSKGAHVMDSVYNDLKNTYKDKFIKKLRKYGIKAR